MFKSSTLKMDHYSVKFAQSFGSCDCLNDGICVVSLLILDKARRKLFLICIISVAIQILGTIYLIKPWQRVVTCFNTLATLFKNAAQICVIACVIALVVLKITKVGLKNAVTVIIAYLESISQFMEYQNKKAILSSSLYTLFIV